MDRNKRLGDEPIGVTIRKRFRQFQPTQELTAAEAELWAELPDEPRVLYCRGPRFPVAMALVDRGLAVLHGSGVLGEAGYFCRPTRDEREPGDG